MGNSTIHIMSNVGKPIESHPSDHPSMGQAKVVKDFPDDGVLAADLSFPSGFWLVPPRQVGLERWKSLARITMDDVNSFDQSMI